VVGKKVVCGEIKPSPLAEVCAFGHRPAGCANTSPNIGNILARTYKKKTRTVTLLCIFISFTVYAACVYESRIYILIYIYIYIFLYIYIYMLL
jgi:hypothetical protein